jgi:hypothetical protein
MANHLRVYLVVDNSDTNLKKHKMLSATIVQPMPLGEAMRKGCDAI